MANSSDPVVTSKTGIWLVAALSAVMGAALTIFAFAVGLLGFLGPIIVVIASLGVFLLGLKLLVSNKHWQVRALGVVLLATALLTAIAVPLQGALGHA